MTIQIDSPEMIIALFVGIAILRLCCKKKTRKKFSKLFRKLIKKK